MIRFLFLICLFSLNSFSDNNEEALKETLIKFWEARNERNYEAIFFYESKIGAIFGSIGEKTSLGFVEETEKQVVIHLQKHLDKISEKDKETIEILKTMQADEDLHAGQANESGAEELESPTKKVMEVTAKMMTSTSAYI